MNDPGVLPGREVRLVVQAAREEMLSVPRRSAFQAIADRRAVCSVISNWTGLPVFFWIMVVRSRTWPPTHTSLIRSRTRSQPRNLLSITRARLGLNI